ncbi:tyrosine-type recombinase/integrase [Leucobacter sp. NPDC058333]|uniref:tyrosine-type recombinase/integrase n=1 Tax=Leucobacter sp. NPDC058333 TaxID=3346450 RepID=UPI00364CFB76
MARAAKGEGTLYRTENGWRGYVTVNSKRKYFSAATKAEASRKKRALLHQRETGHLVAGKVPSMETWLNHWMKVTGPERRETTNGIYDIYIRKYIVPVIGGKAVDKLTMDDLEMLYAGMEASGKSGSTQRQAHSIIRAALKHAVWRGHVGRNVAALVKPPQRAKPDTTTMSEADVRAVHKALVGDPLQARWHLALDLGLRPGEAIALEWKHVDFAANTIRVEQEVVQVVGKGAQLAQMTKTAAGTRVIAVPPRIMGMLKAERARQMLKRSEKGSDWVEWEPDGKPHAWCFTRDSGGPYRPSSDAKNWKALLEKAGVPHTRRYTARHTAASMALSAGADVVSVADMMGHSSPALTLSVYTHAVEERKRALADLIETRHMEAADG